MKKTIKSVISVLIILCILFSFAGCDSTADTDNFSNTQSNGNTLSDEMLPMQKTFFASKGADKMSMDLAFQWSENKCLLRSQPVTTGQGGHTDENGEVVIDYESKAIIELEGTYTPEQRMLTVAFRQLDAKNTERVQHNGEIAFYFSEDGLITHFDAFNSSETIFSSDVTFGENQIAFTYRESPVLIKISEDFDSARIEKEGDEPYSVSIAEDGHIIIATPEESAKIESENDSISIFAIMNDNIYGTSDVVFSTERKTAAWQPFFENIVDYFALSAIGIGTTVSSILTGPFINMYIRNAK